MEIIPPNFDTPEYQEQVRQGKLRHYERVRPFLMDQWPAALWQLSFGPNLLIPFPLDDYIALLDGQTTDTMKKFIKDLYTIMSGRQWFIKSNNRSPKDFTDPKPPITSSAEEVVHMMASSMRMWDDMIGMSGIQKPVYLVLRPVVDIPKRHEFRCFVKDRRLIGISQYFYQEFFEGLEDERDSLRERIEAFHGRVNDAFPENDYVFDVFILKDGSVCLIEVNPYGLSDPCLFESYPRLESEGGFLVRTPMPSSHP